MATLRLREPYRARHIRPVGRLDVDGWRLKLYEIVYDGTHAAAGLSAAARRLVPAAVADLPGVSSDHRVGLVGLHDGRGADFVFLATWTNENELRHIAWMTPDKDPAKLAPVPRGAPTMCTWDLALLAAERDLWVRHVLARPGGPDIDAYLAAQVTMKV